jgi:hypothetical protein
MRHRPTIGLSLTYNRDELLGVVREKRELHSQEYDAAVKGHREQLQERVDSILVVAARLKQVLADGGSAQLKRDERLGLADLHAPVHYLEQYDHAIEMLALTTQTELTLTPELFAKLVQDNWEWKQEFARESGKYLPQEDF